MRKTGLKWAFFPTERQAATVRRNAKESGDSDD
jgi:hypothetical protein